MNQTHSLAGESLANVMSNNFSLMIASEFAEITDPEYEQFLADVWVGIVLTLMVLSCICCMCSCLLYHKFQQWKRSVIEARQAAELENGIYLSQIDPLPTYTMASGLPSYEEALEQLSKVKEDQHRNSCSKQGSDQPRHSVPRLSVTELFQLYRSCGNLSPSASLNVNCGKT